MSNRIKNEAFIAEPNNGYEVDTSLGDVPATLTDPTTFEGSICIYNDGDNKIPLLGFPVDGVSGFKIFPRDRVQLLVSKGRYILGFSNGYHITGTKAWKLVINDETGQATYTQVNI